MSAIIKVRNTDHYDRLEEEIKERGYERDYNCVTAQVDTPHMAVVSGESKMFRTLKSIEEVEDELKDLTYGFVETAFVGPDGASNRLQPYSSII